MTNLGLLHYFLGIQDLHMDDGTFISQLKYVINILHKFIMEQCKLFTTPYPLGVKLTKKCDSPKVNSTLYRHLVDSLICLTHSRSNISFSISVVSWFMKDPRDDHLKYTKILFHYIKGTYQLVIKYCNDKVN
jgi:hypothetical protein